MNFFIGRLELKVFFVISLALCLTSVDIVGFEFGNMTIKLQLVVFPFLYFIYLIKIKFKTDKLDFIFSALFLLALLPSLIFSENIKVSASFYVGAVSCVCTMLFFADINKRIKFSLLQYLLISFYRLAIIITFFLVVFGV